MKHMQPLLKGKKIAILLTNGVEQSELTEPRKALENAGGKTFLVSPANGKIQAMQHKEKGDTFAIDVPLNSAKPEDYDALLLPGGVANPDDLRIQPKAVNFVRLIFDQGKPIAAICHGPWMLVEADIVRDHELTSWPSLRTDIHNAGGTWIDREVVHDGQLTTSRKPDDIPAFINQMLLSFADSSAKGVVRDTQRSVS
jgi:protease I